MHTTLRLCLLLAAALLLAACGGDEDSESSTPKRSAADARKGYFTAAESKRLNPALARYQATSKRFYDRHDACTSEATKLFEAGASARDSVQCHLRDTKAVADAAGSLEQEAGAIDGDYRAACDEALEATRTQLGELRAAWTQLHGDWQAYARGGDPKQINAHAKAADDAAAEFIEERIPALTEACYTKADREQAEQEREAATKLAEQADA